MKNKKEEKYITKSTLKSTYGWTDKLIKEFYPTPDKKLPNPYSTKKPEMCLYLEKNIQKIEKKKVFQKEKLKTNIKKVIAKQSVQTKKQKLLDYLSSVKITIKELPKEKLLERACYHYNRLINERDICKPYADPKTTNKETLDRLCVNYLRHNQTQYHEVLDDIFGKVGVKECYLILRQKIFKEIVKVYPYLEEECKRQQERKESGI